MASLFGYSPEQLIGTTTLDLFGSRYHEHKEKITEHREGGTAAPSWQILEFAVVKDKREMWIEGHQSLITWKGEPAILMTVRDVSERKRKEEELNNERKRLRRENIRLRSTMKDRYRFGDIVGRSLAMQEVYELITRASASDASVIIYGESGTGKDLIARTIHQLSARRKKQFVPVNCGAIQESLFEREFFGHRKGSFTGAMTDKPGFFDAAHLGTLFLDEVGELHLSMQVKLLRAIENKEYTPVGDQKVKYADVRVIAATNRNLKTHVEQGTLAGFLVIGTSVSFVSLLLVGKCTWEEFRLFLLIVPAIALGFVLSRFTIHVLDKGYVRTAILVVSAASGVVVIARSLM